jgi:glyoxylase-like metal-dependent hydrolase (beta-lactamase superfamily II)
MAPLSQHIKEHSMSIKSFLFPALFAMSVIPTGQAAAAPLELEVFNPGEAAIFPVASVLVKGQRDAILVDAQFSRAEALKVVELIKASGKRLTTIYISHGDPDFYFGLDVLQDAFPEAKIVATSHTLASMHKKAEAKVAYWGPILKDNAPRRIVYPTALEGNTMTLEGQSLVVSGPTPERGYVWIPSIKAVVGGVVLFNDLHVWVADTQSPESRNAWKATLASIDALKPATVVPGHFKPHTAMLPESINFTRTYLGQFETESVKAANSAELITTMQRLYPAAGLQAALQTSAKVIKGEIKW